MRLINLVLIACAGMMFFGFSDLYAQPQLERISITERSDGLGLVVRYHLSELAGSYDFRQPEDQLILMEISSPGFTVAELLPVTEIDQIREIEFTELPDGLGIAIYPEEGFFYSANAYPDANGTDLLLTLERIGQNEIRESTGSGNYFAWFETGDNNEEPIQEEQHEPEGEIEVSAEPGKRKNIQIGVKAGVSSNSSFDSNFTSNARTGITMAMSAVINLPFELSHGLKAGIETGIYYTEKGFENPVPQIITGTIFEFDYIEIPVLGKVSLDLSDVISPHLVLGPGIGFMVAAESVLVDDSRTDLDDITNEVDFLGIVGIGIDAKINQSIVSVQLRNSFSLGNVLKKESQTVETFRFKHSYVSLVLGLHF